MTTDRRETTTKTISREGEDSGNATSSRTAATNESHSQDISRLPWRVGEMCGGQMWIKNDVGRPIAHVGVHHSMALEANANARHIVRCVNSHDDLLAALRELARAWNATQFPCSARMDAALADADTAIAKAEGRLS